MQSFILVIGSGLLLLLVLNFIPIGLTFKGKLSVAVIGFLLALAGLAVDTSIPLWQTGLMILLLVLISAYIMDTRFGALLYISESDLLELQVEEDFEYEVFNQSTEKHVEMELLDLEAGPEPEVLPILHIEESQIMPFSKQSQNEVEIENKEIDNDDLLFLDNMIEPDNKDEEIVEEKETGNGYLSDIESLLFEELEVTDSNDESLLQDINVLTENRDTSSVISEGDKNSFNELFLAIEEAASAKNEESIKESDPEREFKLQK